MSLAYGVTGGCAEQTCATDRPYLTRIADAADEMERIAGYIENFIDRCRGGAGAIGLASNAAQQQIPSGHLGQIDRLALNVARVDVLARELQTIG